MPHQMHSCELSNAAGGGSRSAAVMRGCLSVSGAIGLASSQLSKADIRSAVVSVYRQKTLCLCNCRRRTVASRRLRSRPAGVGHVAPSHPRTWREALTHKHKRGRGVKLPKCRRASPNQFIRLRRGQARYGMCERPIT